MKDKQPILSLCIPTYGRCEILKGNLEQIQKQLDSINMDELELIVSNNCSPDKTEEVVLSFINQGMPIVYNCNKENLGADGNFLKCMDMAKGKYIWLLGDDDYLKDGSLAHILDCLRNKDYGLLFIEFRHPIQIANVIEYSDVNDYLCKIGRQLTYMSANIFRKDVVKALDPEKYKNTCLLQMPFFIMSSLNSNVNAITNKDILLRDVGQTASPQSYSFLEVFSKNFIDIIQELLSRNSKIEKRTISYIKKDMYTTYTGSYVYTYMIKKLKFRDKRWQYIWPYYRREGYFYWSFIIYIMGSVKNLCCKVIRKY